MPPVTEPTVQQAASRNARSDLARDIGTSITSGGIGKKELSIFFFKQKTAYELLRSLVGSEMCIRDRLCTGAFYAGIPHPPGYPFWTCLLYTSDAADDLTRVDLGGRRIIKKKKNKITNNTIRRYKHHSIRPARNSEMD